MTQNVWYEECSVRSIISRQYSLNAHNHEIFFNHQFPYTSHFNIILSDNIFYAHSRRRNRKKRETLSLRHKRGLNKLNATHTNMNSTFTVYNRISMSRLYFFYLLLLYVSIHLCLSCKSNLVWFKRYCFWNDGIFLLLNLSASSATDVFDRPNIIIYTRAYRYRLFFLIRSVENCLLFVCVTYLKWK